jgi:hypothetical protein
MAGVLVPGFAVAVGVPVLVAVGVLEPVVSDGPVYEPPAGVCAPGIAAGSPVSLVGPDPEHAARV